MAQENLEENSKEKLSFYFSLFELLLHLLYVEGQLQSMVLAQEDQNLLVFKNSLVTSRDLLVLVLPASIGFVYISKASVSSAEIGGDIPSNNNTHLYIQYLLCATHSTKKLTCIISFNLRNNPASQKCDPMDMILQLEPGS